MGAVASRAYRNYRVSSISSHECPVLLVVVRTVERTSYYRTYSTVRADCRAEAEPKTALYDITSKLYRISYTEYIYIGSSVGLRDR